MAVNFNANLDNQNKTEVVSKTDQLSRITGGTGVDAKVTKEQASAIAASLKTAPTGKTEAPATAGTILAKEGDIDPTTGNTSESK